MRQGVWMGIVESSRLNTKVIKVQLFVITVSVT